MVFYDQEYKFDEGKPNSMEGKPNFMMATIFNDGNNVYDGQTQFHKRKTPELFEGSSVRAHMRNHNN